MRAAGAGESGIVVGFDTEYVERGGKRVIVSSQFATPDPTDPVADDPAIAAVGFSIDGESGQQLSASTLAAGQAESEDVVTETITCTNLGQIASEQLSRYVQFDGYEDRDENNTLIATRCKWQSLGNGHYLVISLWYEDYPPSKLQAIRAENYYTGDEPAYEVHESSRLDRIGAVAVLPQDGLTAFVHLPNMRVVTVGESAEQALEISTLIAEYLSTSSESC